MLSVCDAESCMLHSLSKYKYYYYHTSTTTSTTTLHTRHVTPSYTMTPYNRHINNMHINITSTSIGGGDHLADLQHSIWSRDTVVTYHIPTSHFSPLVFTVLAPTMGSSAHRGPDYQAVVMTTHLHKLDLLLYDDAPW